MNKTIKTLVAGVAFALTLVGAAYAASTSCVGLVCATAMPDGSIKIENTGTVQENIFVTYDENFDGYNGFMTNQLEGGQSGILQGDKRWVVTLNANEFAFFRQNANSVTCGLLSGAGDFASIQYSFPCAVSSVTPSPTNTPPATPPGIITATPPSIKKVFLPIQFR